MKRTDCKSYFLRGYIDAALFTTDPEPPGGADYVECGAADDHWSHIPAEWLAKAVADCQRFETEHAALIERADAECGQDAERCGSDFWYTREGHGCGFWDGDYETEDGLGDKLTAAAKAFGETWTCPEDLGFSVEETAE